MKSKYTTPPLPLSLRVSRLDPEAKLPVKALGDAACWDLYSCIPPLDGKISWLTMSPNNVTKVPTGIAVQPPRGYFLQICSRSGLASGVPPLFVANAPGIIDPDYTGELFIALYNGGHTSVRVQHNQRLAQLLLLPLPKASIIEVKDFPKTTRGGSGFGSSGTD